MNTTSEGGWLVKSETRGKKRGVKEEPDEVLDSLIVLVLVGTRAESVDDRVERVDLHGLLGSHVAGHGGILEGLGLHDTLHVRRPAVLAGDETTWGGRETVGDNHLLGLVAEDLLHELAEILTGGLLLLEVLLLVLGLLEVEALLSDSDKLLAIVVLEGSHLVTRLGGEVTEKLSELGAVLGVLVDTELEVLAELLVELVEVLGVLGDLVEALEGLLDKVLLDDLEDLGALEHLTGNVEREVLGVNDALNEGEELWDEVLTSVGDEDTADVELDVALLLGWLELVEWSPLWHEDHGLELKLALDGEVLDGEVVLPVVADVLVEGGVLLLGDLVWVAHPEWLLLVHELPLVGDFLDGLLLLLLLLILIDLLNLWLVIIAVLILVLILIVGDLLLGGLLDPEGDRVVDELGVLLDELLDALLVEVLLLVILEVEDDLGTAGQVLVRVWGDGEGTTSRRLPDVLLVVIMLGVHGDGVSDEEGRVETDTELTNHGDISASLDGLHEGLGAGLGDGSKVVDRVRLGHTDTGVGKGEGVVRFVASDVDEEVLLGLEELRVGKALVTDLVESIGGVGDELTKEDLLVRIERVDDQRHQLVDLSLEGESLYFWCCHVFLSFFLGKNA